MEPDKRRAAILEAALRAATQHGWAKLTRDHIAAAAGVSPGLVSIRLGSMAEVKRAVRDLADRRRVDLVSDPATPGEWEVLRGHLSPSTRYRLLATGAVGADELTRLIDQLKAQRAALTAARK